MTDYIWQVDDPIGEKFEYVEGMKLTNAATVVRRIIENVSRNGNYMLNISPRSDGTIPDEQKEILLSVGKWLDVNGDGIYGTRAWKQYGEGQVRFTKKGKSLYAILLSWPADGVLISSLPVSAGKVSGVSLLGYNGAIAFTQDDKGLKISLPAEKPSEFAWTLKIEGVNLE